MYTPRYLKRCYDCCCITTVRNDNVQSYKLIYDQNGIFIVISFDDGNSLYYKKRLNANTYENVFVYGSELKQVMLNKR